MAPKYFKGELKWQNITREERVFCAELESHIRKDPERFIDILKKEANLPAELKGPWDTAYEACFYRDYLHKYKPTEKKNYSAKRTFDIALFSDDAVIIIEAKAAEPFTANQALYFQKDIADIKRLLGSHIKVYLVALASQTYFDNYKIVGRGTALDPFENRHLSWEVVACNYPNVPLLDRACKVYEKSPLSIVESDAVPYWKERSSIEDKIKRLEEEIKQRQKAIEALKMEGTT